MAHYNVTQDEHGWTHFDWRIDGVTADMVDWHWSNMDKTFILWHPKSHIHFDWIVPTTKDRFIGAVHRAPQLRRGGTFNPNPPGLLFADPATLPKEVVEQTIYDHACFVDRVDLDENWKVCSAPANVFRLHQWQQTDAGIVGRLSAINCHVENMEQELEKGQIWVEHAVEEVENYSNFLAEMYRLWSVVKDRPDVHFTHSLKLVRTDSGLKYAWQE